VRRIASLALLSALLGCATVAGRWDGAARAPPARPADGFSESDLPETEAPAPRDARLDRDLSGFDLQARLAARARSYLGRRGPFRTQGQRFGSDCSGFVEAVYAAEGISLRELMQRAAPEEQGGVKAAWYAARANGWVFGPPDWPAPGDLVFWNDTYDRNRNGRADDDFTHLGIVEYVEDGTIYFLHRGGRGVTRGVMTPDRPYEATDVDGRPLNSAIRAITHPVKDGGLAGELLAGYGRIDPVRVPAELATRHVAPYHGPGADREAPEVAAIPPATPRPSAQAATPAAAPSRTDGGAPDPAAKRLHATKPVRKLAPKKTGPYKKAGTKKAFARAKPAKAKARSAAESGAPPAQRTDIADLGGASPPSSPTRTADSPKSSSDSLRNTGMTDPPGSR
jgi:probable lipoprotein NlpC